MLYVNESQEYQKSEKSAISADLLNVMKPIFLSLGAGGVHHIYSNGASFGITVVHRLYTSDFSWRVRVRLSPDFLHVANIPFPEGFFKPRKMVQYIQYLPLLPLFLRFSCPLPLSWGSGSLCMKQPIHPAPCVIPESHTISVEVMECPVPCQLYATTRKPFPKFGRCSATIAL